MIGKPLSTSSRSRQACDLNHVPSGHFYPALTHAAAHLPCSGGGISLPANLVNARNILLIKPSSIGDVVHALPIWNLLRRQYPQAQITWLISPVCSGLVEGLPGLQTMRFDRKRWGMAWRSMSAAGDLWRFSRELRHRRFDLVMDVQGLFRSGFFTGLTGAPHRVGFANAREFAPAFYTRRVAIETVEQHAVDRYLKLLEAIGCPTLPVEFPFPLMDEDHLAAADMAKNLGDFAVLCPGANWLTKRWPVQRFAQLVEPLRKQFGLNCVVAGGPGDAALAEQIPGAANLCGKTTLMQLAALMQRAALVITNDSGPMHIAAALDRPLVALFGPTNPIRTGPYRHADSVVRANIDCSPCYRRQCPHQRCLQEMTIEPVLEKAAEQLARSG